MVINVTTQREKHIIAFKTGIVLPAMLHLKTIDHTNSRIVSQHISPHFLHFDGYLLLKKKKSSCSSSKSWK